MPEQISSSISLYNKCVQKYIVGISDLFLLGSTINRFNFSASPIPSVDLECEAVNPSGTLQIHVGPGATLIDYADCTATNPNGYTEKISIHVTTDGLSYYAPGELTIGPNSEVDFQVTIKADTGMLKSTHNLNIKARVEEAAGAPPPNNAESDVSLIVDIMQFSGVSVASISPIVTLISGSDYNIEFRVYNEGNYADKFLLEFSDASRDKLEDEGFQISFPMATVEIESNEWGEGAMKIRVVIRAPSDGSDWPINSEGMHEKKFTATFIATSDFSCKSEGDCNSASVDQIIILQQEASETEQFLSGTSGDNQLLVYGGSGGVVILLMILLVVMKKRKGAQ